MARKNLNNLKSPAVFEAPRRRRKNVSALAGESARSTIGKLRKRCEMFGFTKGQFSLIDLLQAIVIQTGPADVLVSTWTAAGSDVTAAKAWLESRHLLSVRFLVDYSFERRQPEYCATLREAFGDDAIRVTVTHAKFVLIKNKKWNLVIRTSMNLNHNPRFENFEISDDPALMAFFETIVAEIWESQSAGEGFENSPGQNKSTFGGLFKATAAGLSADLTSIMDIV